MRTLFLNFAKLQIPQITCDDLSFPFIWFCVATIGVCVFGALTSVGALFYFKSYSREVTRMLTGACLLFGPFVLLVGIVQMFHGADDGIAWLCAGVFMVAFGIIKLIANSRK